jgi:hypothetical protein
MLDLAHRVLFIGKFQKLVLPGAPDKLNLQGKLLELLCRGLPKKVIG